MITYWWWIDDVLMMNWWWIDDVLTMYWWCIDSVFTKFYNFLINYTKKDKKLSFERIKTFELVLLRKDKVLSSYEKNHQKSLTKHIILLIPLIHKFITIIIHMQIKIKYNHRFPSLIKKHMNKKPMKTPKPSHFQKIFINYL